jgi:hypothetical protein
MEQIDKRSTGLTGQETGSLKNKHPSRFSGCEHAKTNGLSLIDCDKKRGHCKSSILRMLISE